MRSAAAHVAAAGADLIDLNMGCPVPKVCKTGAGAALISDPDRAVAVARAAREGSGLPVTVKLRSGQRPGRPRRASSLRIGSCDEAGVAAIAFHPRSAAVSTAARPTMSSPPRSCGAARRAGDHHRRPRRRAPPRGAPSQHTGADAVMLARGALGNPWLFGELLGARAAAPSPPRCSTSSTG